MDTLLGIILIIVALLVTDQAYRWFRHKYEKQISERDLFFKRTRTELDVLKVVAKHECFGKFKDDPKQFEKWIGDFLALKGYAVLEVTPVHSDGGKDLIIQNHKEEKIYVECKLWNPENWDITVDRPVMQKLVGAMVGDGIKKGLVVTTATLSENAKAYLEQVNKLGFEVNYIDGDALVRELYYLREIKLPEMKERFKLKTLFR